PRGARRALRRGRRHRRRHRPARARRRREVHHLVARAHRHRERGPGGRQAVSVRIGTGGTAADAVRRVVPRLVDERVASGTTAQDPFLWGPEAEARATGRLGWTEAVADTRPLIPEVVALREA